MARLIVPLMCAIAACPSSGQERVVLVRDAQRDSLVLTLLAHGALPPGHELGHPRSIGIDGASGVYVSDDDPARIEKFDAAGRYIRTIGRTGSGPGEFQTPVIGVGGSHIFVHDVHLARLTLLDTAGVLVWSRSVPCCRSAPIRVDRRGHAYILAAPLSFGGHAAWDRVLVINTLGKETDSLLRPIGPALPTGMWTLADRQAALSVPIPFVPATLSTMSDSGTVVRAVSSRYELIESRGDRDTLRILRRESAPVKVPEAVRRRAIDDLVQAYQELVPVSKLRALFRLADVPQVAPAIVALDADDCGRLWVVKTDGRLDNTIRFDVLNSRWDIIGSAEIAGVFYRQPTIAVSRERLAVVVEGGDGAPELAVFRVTPSGLGCHVRGQ